MVFDFWSWMNFIRLVVVSFFTSFFILIFYFQKKFGNRLLAELKIANILLIQDVVDDFACISRHGEENGSCDHIITLKDPAQIAQVNTIVVF